MRITMLGGAALFVVALAGAAFATGGGKILTYGGGGQGKVIFDGRTHASAGLACAGCHTSPALFPMRKQALITMTDHGQPKACFACHDGAKAFFACDKCHRKFY